MTRCSGARSRSSCSPPTSRPTRVSGRGDGGGGGPPPPPPPPPTPTRAATAEPRPLPPPAPPAGAPPPPAPKGAPRAAAAVTGACLAPAPAARPGSAVLPRKLAELADAAPATAPAPAPVRRPAVVPASGTRVLPRPPPPAPPPWIPDRPRRWPWAFSGLVVLVLTFLAGVVFAEGRRGSGVAADPAGIATPAAPATSAPPARQPSPTLGCTVTYKVTASVSSEFGADLSIANNGGSGTSGWTLVFDLPGEQTVRFGWAGRWDQKDRTVTVHDLVYNASLGQGKSTSIGFVGTHAGKGRPGNFTLNGVRCLTAS